MSQQLAVFGLPGGLEWIFIGLVALLVFGRRLPDVARSVGKSIVEFKRGLRDAKSEMDLSGVQEPDSLLGNTQRPGLEAKTGTSSATDSTPPQVATDQTAETKSE
ncbi:MAG: twin-arginine translocase TatA/TatE family subunit [Phycisphaerae bacterium]